MKNDDVMMTILFQLIKMKQNQKEFKDAIDDFIITSNEILDEE